MVSWPTQADLNAISIDLRGLAIRCADIGGRLPLDEKRKLSSAALARFWLHLKELGLEPDLFRVRRYLGEME
jgi:hypothetical protein